MFRKKLDTSGVYLQGRSPAGLAAHRQQEPGSAVGAGGLAEFGAATVAPAPRSTTAC